MPYAITRWSRTPDTWTHEYQFTVNKTLISFSGSGEYKRFNRKIEDGGVNFVPKMTSNTSPEGVASASSIWSTLQDAYFAFNGVIGDSNKWLAGKASYPQWLTYDLGTNNQKIVKRYGLATGANNQRPKTWRLEGSNDNQVWDTIHTHTSDSFILNNIEVVYFDVVNENPYRYYRLYLESGEHASISIFELIDEKTITPSTWQTVSTTLPTKTQFETEGMDDLSVFDRQSTTFTQDMTNDGVLESGTKFSTTIDLKKYFDITEIRKV